MVPFKPPWLRIRLRRNHGLFPRAECVPVCLHGHSALFRITVRTAVSRAKMKCASASSRVYSCSVDGTVLEWNVSTLRVTSRFQLPSGGLSSIRLHGGCVWCCESPVLPPALALRKTGQDEHAACLLHAFPTSVFKARCLSKLWSLLSVPLTLAPHTALGASAPQLMGRLLASPRLASAARGVDTARAPGTVSAPSVCSATLSLCPPEL